MPLKNRRSDTVTNRPRSATTNRLTTPPRWFPGDNEVFRTQRARSSDSPQEFRQQRHFVCKLLASDSRVQYCFTFRFFTPPSLMAGDVRSKGETIDTGFAGVGKAKALDDPAEKRNVAAGIRTRARYTSS
jgi:hypothetical protein